MIIFKQFEYIEYAYGLQKYYKLILRIFKFLLYPLQIGPVIRARVPLLFGQLTARL